MQNEDPNAERPRVEGRTLDPSDWPEFRAQAHRMLDDILGYIENIRERPVWQPAPDEARRRFHGDLPEAPSDLAAVHEEFMRFILPYSAGKYSFTAIEPMPADNVAVLLPKSMSFTAGVGAVFTQVEEDPGILTFIAKNALPGKTIAFTVSGTGSMPPRPPR